MPDVSGTTMNGQIAEGEARSLEDLAVPVEVRWPDWVERDEKTGEIVDLSEITSFRGIDVADGPTFTVSEAAQIFFGRTAFWLRGQEKKYIKKNRLPGRSEKQQRYYTLIDVEHVAEDLYENGRISEERFVLAMTIVRLIGRVNDYPVEVYGTLCPHCDNEMQYGQVLYLEAPRRNVDGRWVHWDCANQEFEERTEREKKENLQQLHADRG